MRCLDMLRAPLFSLAEMKYDNRDSPLDTVLLREDCI